MSYLSDRQAAASRQGRAFEEYVKTDLLMARWTILRERWRHPDVDIEIDIVALDPDGVEWWIECKGSWESTTRNGLERTDTAKKAIGSAAILRLLPVRCPYLLITSHLPLVGSSGDRWMQLALGTYFDDVRVIQPASSAYQDDGGR